MINLLHHFLFFERRTMPRKARKYIESNYIHVIVQGINRETIFYNSIHIKKYLKEIKSKIEEYENVKILAYCMMNNHAHFLIYTKNINDLSKFMQRVNNAYSNFYNKHNDRVGFVFRDRFFTQEICSQRQLFTCLKYIHNNPVKAKITNTPGQYRYSSFNEFLYGQKIIDKEAVKILFGNCNDYKDFFISIHNMEDDEELEIKDIKEECFEEFIENFQIQYKVKISNLKNNREMLEKFVKESRKGTAVKIEKIAEVTGISKSVIGRIAKK